MDPTRRRFEQFADLIAERVAERLLPRLAELVRDALQSQPDGALIGPDELARRLGRSVDFVRDHAEELGAIRVGDGPKPRLLFRPDTVAERLRDREAGPKQNGREPRPRPRTRPGRTPSGAPLLEVKGNNPRRHT